jgi:hypothetical protein
MRVDAQRHRGVGMAQTLRHGRSRYTFAQHAAGVTVTQAVQAPSEPSLSHHLYMANYQFCLSARVFDLLIPLPECAISLFYSFI